MKKLIVLAAALALAACQTIGSPSNYRDESASAQRGPAPYGYGYPMPRGPNGPALAFRF